MDLPWWRWQTSFISKATGFVFPVTQSLKYFQEFICDLVVTTTTGIFFCLTLVIFIYRVYWLCIAICNSVSTTLVIRQCSQTMTFFKWWQFFEVFALAVQFNWWLLLCFLSRIIWDLCGLFRLQFSGLTAVLRTILKFLLCSSSILVTLYCFCVSDNFLLKKASGLFFELFLHLAV